MKTKVAIAVLAVIVVALGAAGCTYTRSHGDPHATAAAAALPVCSSAWTLAAKITTDQAGADCWAADGTVFHPEQQVCDPATHHGVAVSLYLGPDGRYAVFVEPDARTEVDDGTGTGDYRDDQTAEEQEVSCAPK